MSSPAGPPVPPRRPERRVHHGRTFDDPYAWMRDTESQEFLAHLGAENAWTQSRLAHLEPLRDQLFGDIVARTQETDLSVPTFVRHLGGRAYWYFTRTYEGREYGLVCRAPATDDRDVPAVAGDERLPAEECLLDVNDLAEGAEFLSLGVTEVSPGGGLLAFSTDIDGDETYALRFKDLATGEILPTVLDGVSGGGVWLTDDDFCYLRHDDAWRPFQVWRHRLSTGSDTMIVQEDDERFWLGLDGSRDWRFVLIASGSKTTSECALLDAHSPDADARIVAPRREGVEYDVEIAPDRLFVVHNDGAIDFALAEAPLDATSHADWITVWPGEPGVRLLGVSAYEAMLVASLRRDGDTVLRLVPRDGDLLRWETGTELGAALTTLEEDPAAVTNPSRLRLVEESFLDPRTVVELDPGTGQRHVLKRRVVRDHTVQGPYDPALYLAERLWATADDGARIPISVVRRRDLPLDGNAPCLLYGYGAYEISLAPAFSVSRLSLLDRGFVVATAHVRGGGELGRRWYEEGKLFAKRTTFTDFIACARHLVDSGHTSPERLVAEGGSAGGLLAGAVANLAPELFAGIHADVPFVDALTVMLDPDLPLTVTEWDEWGDPLHDADAYDYLQGYTPYENVVPDRHPRILATSSLHDTRVEVTEPAKWIAALRHADGPEAATRILLHVELAAGHGGVSGRRSSWRQAAFELAWIVDAAGAAGIPR